MIKKIVIVGGGTSGWMTASMLYNSVGQSCDLDILLIESPDFGVIGVGEATTPSIVTTIKSLGIEEDDFLKNVNGAFKQAIRFEGWLHDPSEKSSYFYHPFHKGADADILAAAQFLRFNPLAGPESYARLASPQIMACDANKAPGPLHNASSGGFAYAYHMDAVLFARLLRGRFEGGGRVKRIEGSVVGVTRDGEGNIESVVMKGGEKITGDFFIDCSGFRGLLINEQLGVPFSSFSRWLPCDRALAVSVPYCQGERIKPYTIASAQQHGWIWDINLSSRRGVGYVYCSDYADRGSAEAVLRSYLGKSCSSQENVREIKIRTGRCDSFWHKNCVAIGLSGGFIEPLESTGIYLAEVGIRYLIDHWPVKEITPYHGLGYTALMKDAYDSILEFIFMHYYTSQRSDSDFWRDFSARRDGLSEVFLNKLDLWKSKYPSAYDTRMTPTGIFSSENFMAVLSGMGWTQGVLSPYVVADDVGLRKYLKSRLYAYEKQVSGYPSHEEYLSTHGVKLDAAVYRG